MANSETKAFCEQPIASNEDVQKWQDLLAEATKDLCVKLENGQTVPKKLAEKKLDMPFKEALKVTKGGEESMFQAFLKDADPRQIDAMEKELEKAGIDTKNMAFLGSGNNSTVLVGKNSEGKMVAIKPTFNKDEATSSELGNYNFKPEHASVIGADGSAQEKMEKRDGSIGLAVNPIALPLDVLTDHLKKKYDISDDVMKARERDIENVICKTSNQACPDLGQTRENVGTLPDAPEGQKGQLLAIDTGSFRPWSNFEKDGGLSRRGATIKDMMDEKAAKVPNITMGFGKAPEKEAKTQNNVLSAAAVKSKIATR